MAARLGNVIYWAASGLACLIAIYGVLSVTTGPYRILTGGERLGMAISVLIVAAFVWLVGRACRYVLGGK